MVSFCFPYSFLYLLIGILLQERAVPSSPLPPFIYLFNYSFTSVCICRYFILWVVSQYCCWYNSLWINVSGWKEGKQGKEEKTLQVELISFHKSWSEHTIQTRHSVPGHPCAGGSDFSTMQTWFCWRTPHCLRFGGGWFGVWLASLFP